ncbi:hypothetical protein [Paenibacillus taichungensis]|uniref:hypothetical protein n=1 Tax=Paenibacillus taichungensis TaxID=484184 RepID=UPI0039A4FC8C
MERISKTITITYKYEDQAEMEQHELVMVNDGWVSKILSGPLLVEYVLTSEMEAN